MGPLNDTGEFWGALLLVVLLLIGILTGNRRR